MEQKEAQARIKINKLLEDAGWRFFDTSKGEANIQLEPNVKITQHELNELGDDFERTKNGFVDYLLLDEDGRPFVVVEAKKKSVHPLTAKEQARKYANTLRAKFIILTNGDIHYFWNLSKGNPELITAFPSYENLKTSKALITSVSVVDNVVIDKYYIAKSQDPMLETSAIWKSNDDEVIMKYCESKNIRVLRDYQVKAINSIKLALRDSKNRFLLEMATGTGKTLVSAGIIKLFLRTELANRVLFLVDRIELENQAKDNMRKYLAKDGIKVSVYKENKSDWKSADVVISTIQSFSFDNKYQKIFKPSDFDLVISDEAHRSLGASNRAIFEYFIGYKLGLTATPKNYLKGVNFDETDPREIEKRVMLDTYHIFGCDSGVPTFSYTLNDGVQDKILVNPKIVDCRSDITTQLLSDKGLIINTQDDNVEIVYKDKEGKTEKVFDEKAYEKTFFSDSTNRLLCKTFMDNAERDPISNEIGKGIVFCVNIAHARKITEILNDYAEKMFPGMYNSDFAIQITSDQPDAQQMTINFANNNLNGKTRWLEEYESSKSRIAVTVGMMTTGYDCSDILNLTLFRPIFSPSDFIQIKGRGTRLHTFKYDDVKIKKSHFKLFDFFAVCDYFESEFNYDEKIKIPKLAKRSNETEDDSFVDDFIVNQVISKEKDTLVRYDVQTLSVEGMKIDRKFYQSFADKVASDPIAKQYLESNNSEALEFYIQNNILDKPNEFYTIKKLERALGLDRRLTIKEVVNKLLGKIEKYKSKSEMLDDEFNNFILINKEDLDDIGDGYDELKNLFEAYILDRNVRECVKNKQLQYILNSPIGKSLRILKDFRIKGQRPLDFIREYVVTNDLNCEKFE